VEITARSVGIIAYILYAGDMASWYQLFWVPLLIRNNKHQLMHRNIYNLYSWKSPTCFDPAGPSSGRIVLIHYGCFYTVNCECALGFILRLRGIVFCPRSGYTQPAGYTQTADKTILPEDGPAGSKHVGDFHEWRLYICRCISWCLLFRMIQCTDMEHILS
jgi:hypothetical protein